MSPSGRRGFPAHFDQDAWEEDLARSTPAGREVADAARRDYERDGIPFEHLRRVQEHGSDGTVLPDCAKVYLPLPAGRFGIVFRAIKVEDRPALPTWPSACAITRETPSARPSISSPTNACTANHQDAQPHKHDARSYIGERRDATLS